MGEVLTAAAQPLHVVESEPAPCVFCRIARGQLPCDFVRETPLTMAFKSVQPETPTHIIVIPKEHMSDVLKARGEVLPAVMETAQRVIDEVGAARGFRMVINTGEDAGQTVPHFHVHLLAGRRMGDIAVNPHELENEKLHAHQIARRHQLDLSDTITEAQAEAFRDDELGYLSRAYARLSGAVFPFENERDGLLLTRAESNNARIRAEIHARQMKKAKG